MVKQCFRPNTLPPPIGPYSQVVEATGKRIIFIAGQVAENSKGELIGKGDVDAQTRQIFENLKVALASRGATLDDVAKVMIFLTDLKNFDAMNKVRKEYLKGNFPISTLAVVKSLARPEWLVEIEATAVMD